MKKSLCYLLIAVALIGGIYFMDANNSEAEAKSLYESSISDKSAVRASHILVSTKEEALKIKSDIEANKISFAQAASKYSKCPSGRNGGDLGFFGRGQMVRPFEVSAFSLPLNTVSQPVQTQFGYHLILVTDIK